MYLESEDLSESSDDKLRVGMLNSIQLNKREQIVRSTTSESIASLKKGTSILTSPNLEQTSILIP